MRYGFHMHFFYCRPVITMRELNGFWKDPFCHQAIQVVLRPDHVVHGTGNLASRVLFTLWLNKYRRNAQVGKLTCEYELAIEGEV